MSDVVAGSVAVVLNYRTAEDTIRAVRSLENSHTRPSHVIVVDNASGDGSIEQFSRELTNVKLIVASSNAGFSAGCNLGIAEALHSGARCVLLLNSDAIMGKGTLGLLERELATDPHLGIVGPAVISTGEDERIESLGVVYSPRSGRMRHVGHGQPVSALPPFERRDVDAVSGCAMLIRREVLSAVGLLAEEFFFGFEDLDFCLRAREAGWTTACLGTCSVRHAGNRSIGRKSPHRTYYAVRNHLLLARRLGLLQPLPVRAVRATTIVGLNLAHALVTSDVPRRAGLPALVRGVLDHLSGRYGRFPG